MRRLIALLTPCLLLAGLACAPEPEEPNAFDTQGFPTTTATATATATATETDTQSETSGDSASTEVPPDMGDPAGDGDGDEDTTTTTTGPGDGDGEPDPTTTTTGNDAECGNGIIDNGEQCDGGNLGGFTCVDLGYSGGTLACDPITCTYDASGCVTDMDQGGNGTTG